MALDPPPLPGPPRPGTASWEPRAEGLGTGTAISKSVPWIQWWADWGLWRAEVGGGLLSRRDLEPVPCVLPWPCAPRGPPGSGGRKAQPRAWQKHRLVVFQGSSLPIPPPFFFLRLHLQYMEVPGLGGELELQLLADATATAMRDRSSICDLHHTAHGKARSLTH